MTFSDKIGLIRDALALIDVSVYHYRKAEENKTTPWIVWAEDGEGESMAVDNRRLPYQSVHGTIDLFTLTEYDQLVDEIQETLDELEAVAWRLSSVQYEDETNLIHYEWEFEVA